MYKLGIDVGGTNTDAVLVTAENQVTAEVKYPTSGDIYSGIIGAIRTILKSSGIDPSTIRKAMLGTTQCTNAIVERKHLTPVGILRIGAPATLGIQPMADWDEDIRKICVSSAIIGGGYEYDGRELAPLDEQAAKTFFENIRGRVGSVAICGVFANVRNDQELKAAALCRRILGDTVSVSLSHEIGTMGLVERENATILNAALFDVSRKFTSGFVRSLADLGITEADVFLSQNDGTLMTIDNARRYPVLTIVCGPTNSIRGASYLSRLREAIVIDIGGTTTDFGVVHNGFPRESSTAVTIGGIRTNFRMPDVLSIGLGGGSIVRQHQDGSVSVGPDSVGYEITSRSLVFGGDTTTATDIAVRLGMANVGDPSYVAELDETFARQAMKQIVARVEDSIDIMKLSDGNADVILVGGGSIILPEHLSGAGRVIKPKHFGVANAIGSAISKVSGNCDCLVDYQKVSRDTAMHNAQNQAISQAVKAGAVPGTVEIVDSEDVHLAYHPGNTFRIKVKAVGDLA